MNSFKKTAIAVATVSTIAVAAAAPAQAGSKSFKKGLGFGIGLGVGAAVTGAILNNRNHSTHTVIVQQPTCYDQVQQYYDQFGILRARTVRVCQ